MGISAGESTTFSFLIIVGGIMIAQAIMYKIAIKKHADGTWNRVGGLIVGLVEGGIFLSLIVIFFSIYFHFPSAETRRILFCTGRSKILPPASSTALTPFCPESEDFYQEIMNSVKKSSNHKETPLHQ